MTPPVPLVPDAQLSRYLLGTLRDPDLERIEALVFADPDLFDRLRAVESDLIDAYVLGTMGPADRRRLEQRLLQSAEGQQKLAFARALLDHSAAPPARAGWQPVAAVLAAAVILLAAALWSPGLPDEAVVLHPDEVRSASTVRVVEVPKRDLTVALYLDPAEPGGAFEIELFRGDAPVWRTTGQRDQADAPELTLPAEALERPGAYRLELRHGDRTLRYRFTVAAP